MKEGSERSQREQVNELPDGQKCGSKSANTVVVTQPSADLNKYLVDKFHPPTTTAKPALFESIDLSIYQPSARCAAFCTSESRLLRWIHLFQHRYYEYLNSESTEYKTIWKEQEAYSSPSKCEKIVIHLFETSSISDEQLVTLTVFVSTGRILIQGKKYKEWCTDEFPVLLELVNKIQTLPSSDGKSFFTTSLSSFFKKAIIFVSEDDIYTSSNTAATNPDSSGKSTDPLATPAVESLTVSPTRLNTISTLRDTVGTLEAEFTQFQTICSGDIQQLKDKIVQQDNTLKLQRKALDDIVSDLSSQVKSISDDLHQQSVLIQKLREENQLLHKKNARLSEANADLEKKQRQLEKEMADLRKHLDNPVPEPVKPQTCENTANASIVQETSFEEQKSSGPLLINLPTENRFSALREPDDPQDKDTLPPAHTNDNLEQSPPNAVNTNAAHAVFLCDSNGKYLKRKKMFPPNQKLKYFRCPTIAQARNTLTELQDTPQLLLIHTGTNDLTITTPIDEITSNLLTLITEAATKFPTSKIIYSTLLPRSDIPMSTITKINEQLIAKCSSFPNVHLVSHDNLLAAGSGVLHDTKHINRQYIGLFASNLIAAIRGRANNSRYSQIRLPRHQQSSPANKYPTYSHVLQSSQARGNQNPNSFNSPPYFQRQQPLLPSTNQYRQPPHTPRENDQTLASGASKDAGFDIPKELISFLRFVKTFI